MNLVYIWQRCAYMGPLTRRMEIRRKIRQRMSLPTIEPRPRRAANKPEGRWLAELIAITRHETISRQQESRALELWKLIKDSAIASIGTENFERAESIINRILHRCNNCGTPHNNEGPTAAHYCYCEGCRTMASEATDLPVEEFDIPYGQTGTIAVGDSLELVRIALQLERGFWAHLDRVSRHSDQVWRIGPDLAGLRAYSFRTGALHVIRDTDQTFGIELEVAFETASQQGKFTRQLHGTFSPKHCSAKHDSSILNSITQADVIAAGHSFRGEAEIVSGYGRFDSVEDVMIRAMAIARKHGAKCPSSCGMHIAAGRNNLTESQIARVICFWSNPENRKTLDLFQRREPNRFCLLNSQEFELAKGNPDRLIKDCSWVYSLQHGRYAIVSTAHSSHIEFRGFAGSMSDTINRARLALVAELIEYCAQPLGLSDLTAKRFKAWLNNRGTETAARTLRRMRARKPGIENLKSRRTQVSG